MYSLAMYSPLSKWRKGDPLSPPFVCMSVGIHSAPEEENEILLSSELMSEQEIDHAVEALKNELEEFRIKSKQELKRLKRLMHN